MKDWRFPLVKQDPEQGSVYIHLAQGCVKRTVELVPGIVFADYDENEILLGVEIP